MSVDIKKAWKDKASTVIGWFAVIFVYVVLISIVIVSIIPFESIRTFFDQYAFLILMVSISALFITFVLLVWFFEGRTKMQLYKFLKPSIEAFAFVGSSYYLNITKADGPIGFVIISLILLGIIKVIDAILALRDYLFIKSDQGPKED